MCVNKNVHVQILCSKLLELPACISFCLRPLSVMSLLSWLKKSQTTKQLAYEIPKVADLPDPNSEDNAVDGACLVILKPK